MDKSILIIGLVFILLFSSIIPMSIGFNVKQSNEEEVESRTLSDGGLMDSAWPMFQHDAKHTSCSPYGKSGNWFILKWKVNIGDWAESSPAIDKNGTIYIGGGIDNKCIHAINPDGTKKWSFKTEDLVSSSPAIAEDGTIYVGSEDGRLYAIYPNGTLKWKFGTGDWVVSPPTIDTDGTLYFGSFDTNIYAVYPNGTVKWNYKTDAAINPSPAIDDDTVYCGSNDWCMYAIYKNNGTLKWKFCGDESYEWMLDASIDKDGIIYFSMLTGTLYAVYPNGTKKWELDKEKLGTEITSVPAIAKNGTIYLTVGWPCFYSGGLFSINPDGTINWKYLIDTEDIGASPTIDKYGVIYFGDRDGIFYAINPDGTLKWKYKALDCIFSSAAISEDGTIYFSSFSDTFDANLYAIEPINDNPPEMPAIDGSTNGNIKTNYIYTAVTNDPNNDHISYYFDWGDGTNSGWSDFFPSGISLSLSHSWQRSNTYTIKVKAKDIYNMESDWGTFEITIPRSRTSMSSWFLSLAERFPILLQLLIK